MQETSRSSSGDEEPIFLALLLRKSSVAPQVYQWRGVAFIENRQLFQVDMRDNVAII